MALSTLRARSPAFRRLCIRDKAQTMVSVAFPRALASYLRRHGVDPCLLAPEFADETLMQGRHVRFPAETYCQMLLRSAEALDDPLLGLHLGQTLIPADLGELGYALMSCPNVGEALLRIQRYHRLLNDVTPLEVHAQGDTIELRWGVAHGRMGALYDECGLTAFIELGRRLSGLRLAPRQVAFVNPPPEDPTPYIHYFGCPVFWSQPETCLTISQSSLQLPLVRPDQMLLRLMDRQVDDAFSALGANEVELADAIRRVVRNLADRGVPELPQVACELQMSPKVLYRRLAGQGMNFRALRDDALRQMAERLLMTPGKSLTDIARCLGYTQTSAFVRAFKRWTGMTPVAWRRREPHGPAVTSAAD